MAVGRYEYRSDYARRYYSQGEVAGRPYGVATAVLAVLRARRVEVSDDVHRMTTGCVDLELLCTWARRAATATSLDDVFDDVVLEAPPVEAGRYLEVAPSSRAHEFPSDFARRYFDQGKVEGRATGVATGVLAVLTARRVKVPEDARVLISECPNLGLLHEWAGRAASAYSLDDVFNG